jgi:hypothetical protein
MKRALKLSLFVNLLLAVWVTWLSVRPSKPANPNSPAQPLQGSREIVRLDPGQSQPKTEFRWSRIESADYRQYINNLKAIGCPQQTIRDIITADVHSLYVARGEQLGRQPMAAKIRSEKFQALREEENSVLAALLGFQSDAQNTSESFQSARATQANAQNNNVSVPLAFRPTDLSALNLNEDQLESIQYLRSAFQRELRDSDHDRTSPEYLKQCQSAQAQNDLMLRGMLGTKLFEQVESAPKSGANTLR